MNGAKLFIVHRSSFIVHNLNVQVLEVLKQTWGYESLRPLQEAAIKAVLGRRDSLVVLPTGGGKSLCYQLPPLLTGELTVVVSPLISLMKDQVDTLRDLGVDARQINSTTTEVEKRDLVRAARDKSLRMLFVSPERLAMDRFQDFLKSLEVRTFAIDEAHCISHWGHDFRPEYRQMGELREMFPEAAIHAYTATATETVRRDIANQLRLNDPEILVGSFDRPNLTYRILPRVDPMKQVLEVIERHQGEAGIIYCIRKKDVDETTASLRKKGIDARPYHAGLSKEERTATQEAFANETCNIVVATVAFGMGIDRSNIRFVLHTGLPKSIEHYQQETGRAGRDGLEADCVLLYSGADVLLWRSIDSESIFLKHINDMDRYARGAVCRHRAIVNYFGEEYASENCNACDLCLGDVQTVDDANVIAQKILSCVVRVDQRFGIGHVISILRGEKTERVLSMGHDRLSTYGLLAGHPQNELRDWIYQLIGQGVLAQEGDQYPILRLTEKSRGVLRGEESVRLVQVVRKEKRKKAKVESESWEGVDQDLFESLRKFRRDLASSRGVPPYIILGDKSLREIARVRPQTLTELRDVYGIGDKKLEDLGEMILNVVTYRLKPVPTVATL